MNKSVFLFIFFAALSIVWMWFSEGLILGTAEAKIPFYRLESFQKITENTWFETNLGNTSSLIIASGPSWWILSQLQNIGIPGFVLQAFVFWFLFVISGVGIYQLTTTLFPKLNKNYLIFCVLFYWFNPLALVNIWNRFLYNYMVFYAILPFLMFLYIRGLETRKYIFGIIIPLFLAFFSYALTAYVFNLLIIFLFLFTWLFFIITNFKKDFIFFSLILNLIIIAGSIITNAWWVLPTWTFINSQSLTQELPLFVTPEGNLYTLNVISQKLGHLIDITRFLHIAFYDNEGPIWARHYIAFPVNILFSILSGIIFLGIYRYRKEKWGLYLGALFFVGIFLAKGNQGPYGDIFQWFFRKSSIIQVFRDPFEKFTFILILVSAPLFALGTEALSTIIKGKIKYLSQILAVIILSAISIPFLTGLVFTSKNPPNDIYSIGYKVKVPSYYKEANQWLSSQGRNFRFISYPLGDEGITYKWEKGYQGVEPSEILFSNSGITFNTSVPYYSQIVDQLEKLLFHGQDYSKVANMLNVRYLMLRFDVDIRERRLRDPKIIESLLEKKVAYKEFEKVNQFGSLIFWENLKWIDKTVYVSNSITSVISNPTISDFLFDQVSIDSVLVAKNHEKPPELDEELEIIHPQEENSTNQDPQIFEKQKKYHFNLMSDATYEFILDNVYGLEKEVVNAAELKIFVDSQPLIVPAKKRADNKLIIGKIKLDAGSHDIIVERVTGKNLVSVSNSVSIKPVPTQNEASFEVANFDSYSRYLVGFDYLFKSGSEFIFMFAQSNDLIRNGNVVPQHPYFTVITSANSNSFVRANGIYTPAKSEQASLIFWTDMSKNSEIDIKDISLQRLIEPKPVLIKENPKKDLPLPKLTYIKHTPAKYSVQIKGANNPFALVLSELFNSEWEARIDGSKINNHFLANSYANGWIVDKKGDYTVEIEFAHERLLVIGKVISGTSSIAGLIYIGSVLWRKKESLWK